jgi:hypothetical protein
MFGQTVDTGHAESVLKDAAITIITAELMQAFGTIRNDKVALRKAVQQRLRALKVDHNAESAALPQQLFARCTAALQLK